jgi:uncharacterized lipoprotein YajG
MRPNLLLLMTVATSLTGCATTDARISLRHSEAVTSTSLSAPRTVALGVIQAEAQLASPRQGVKKNGYGMDTANLYTDPAPTEHLRSALQVELTSAGFTVESVSNGPSITVELHQFFVEPEVGAWAADVFGVVDATVSVQHPGTGQTYRRRFKGIGKVRTLMWTNGIYREAYERALRDFLEKSVPEVVSLFERERLSVAHEEPVT